MLGKGEGHVLETLQSLIKKGEKCDAFEEEIDDIKSDLEISKEENYYLKNKLETKRDIIDDMEIELEKYENKLKDALKKIDIQNKELEIKEMDLEAFEVFVKKQVDEINILADNNQSMVKQISENIMMEKCIDIQNGVIKELQGRLKFENSESDEKAELTTEVDKLILENEQLQRENEEKAKCIKSVEKEKEVLEDKLNEEQEKRNDKK